MNKFKYGVLTKRQQEVLEFIKDFKGQHGFTPTINEIAVKFEVLNNAIVCILKALVKHDKIYREPRIRRGLRIK